MSEPKRSANDVINAMAPDLPVGRASDLTDAAKLADEGARQERERQRVVDQASADSPIRLRGDR